MLNTIRNKLAKRLVNKGTAYIRKGDFKNIMKGLQYFKLSVRIAPLKKEEWEPLRDEMFDVINTYLPKLD